MMRYGRAMDKPSALLCVTTFGSLEKAREIALILVDEELAACVNMLPEARSVYRWRGNVEEEGEVVCLIKTTPDAFERLRERLVELHPYELPELISLPILGAHPPYLEWLLSGVK
jgi:periplasmic divalent cation tolerance protein